MKKSLLLSSTFVAATLISQTAMAEAKLRAGIDHATFSRGDYEANYNPINLGATYAFNNGAYIDLALSNGSGTGTTFSLNPSDSFKHSERILSVGAKIPNRDDAIAGTFHIGIKSETSTLDSLNTTLTLKGIVTGGGVSFPIAGGTGGSIGLNIGLDFLRATTSDLYIGDTNKNVGGTSLELKYSYPFTSKFGIAAHYKTSAYSDSYEKITALGATAYIKF